MKNISRRVFIKGMAVAAVATAASTVLTGCKLPVGPEEPEVVPTPANSYTYTDGEKTLTITAPNYELNTFVATGNNTIYLKTNVQNGLEKSVAITKTVPTTSAQVKDGYYVKVVSAQAYGSEGEAVGTALQAVTTAYTENLLSTTAPSIVAGTNKNGQLEYTIPAAIVDKWASIEVKFEVYKAFGGKNNSNVSVNVPIKVDSFSFTFKK